MRPLNFVSFLTVLFLNFVFVNSSIIATCRTDKSVVLKQFVEETKILNDYIVPLRKFKSVFDKNIKTLKLPSELEAALLDKLDESSFKDSSILATTLINILQSRCRSLNNKFIDHETDIPLEVYSSSSYRTDKILKLIPERSSNLVIIGVFGLVAVLACWAYYFAFIKEDESISI